jgi:hypothetical protein
VNGAAQLIDRAPYAGRMCCRISCYRDSGRGKTSGVIYNLLVRLDFACGTENSLLKQPEAGPPAEGLGTLLRKPRRVAPGATNAFAERHICVCVPMHARWLRLAATLLSSCHMLPRLLLRTTLRNPSIHPSSPPPHHRPLRHHTSAAQRCIANPTRFPPWAAPGSHPPPRRPRQRRLPGERRGGRRRQRRAGDGACRGAPCALPSLSPSLSLAPSLSRVECSSDAGGEGKED